MSQFPFATFLAPADAEMGLELAELVPVVLALLEFGVGAPSVDEPLPVAKADEVKEVTFVGPVTEVIAVVLGLGMLVLEAVVDELAAGVDNADTSVPEAARVEFFATHKSGSTAI